MTYLDLGAPVLLYLRIDEDGAHCLTTDLAPDRVVALLRGFAFLVETGRVVPAVNRAGRR